MGDELLSVEDYRGRILAEVAPLEARQAPLRDCLGLVLAEDVVSDLSLPSFDNSSMDGYAVRAGDVEGASPARPITLPVVGEIGAGRPGPTSLTQGTATKIMTGAAVPQGADAVVPYEWTDRGTPTVSVHRGPARGQHIRRVGEDVAAGDRVLIRGTMLGPRQLSLLAAIGRAEMPVHPRPRVAIVSTGAELRRLDEPLDADSLYDSNSVLLALCAERSGAEVAYADHVSDDPADFLALLDQLSDVDLIVTSGGISMGDFDVVKAALAPRGVWFGGLAMQPGKPQGFGRLRGGALLMAMPGNPVSAFVSFQQFVVPVLRRLMGITPEVPASSNATLAAAVTSPPDRRQFLRGRVGTDGTVRPVGGAGSHLLGGLADADCIIVIPEATTELNAGDTVQVIEMGVL